MSRMKYLPQILFRVVVCAIVLSIGFGIMVTLAKQRKPPVAAEIRERAIRVEARKAVFENVPVMIEATGQVRARDVVSIAPEVAGRVEYVHPLLEMGEVIPEGDVLVRIDPRDYQAHVEESNASISMWETTVSRLQQEFKIDEERLVTLRRNAELAKGEYERVKQLFEVDSVGTQSGVDQSERAWNSVLDQADQLAQQVSLYPARIQEARASLQSMHAMAGLAGVNLERTEIKAPFNARIREVHVEVGQYVRPGFDIMTLADDSVLEIPVGLNQRQQEWLKFGEQRESVRSANKAWFNALEEVPVEVQWVDQSDMTWRGTIDRVEQFDPTSRMLRVVVRVGGADAISNGADLPLVDGMFCNVRIPGLESQNVVRLPASAVSFPRPGTDARTVYVAREDEPGKFRLKTTEVRESHYEGQEAFIVDGLQEDDVIVTTRLVNPLENSLLDVTMTGTTEIDS